MRGVIKFARRNYEIQDLGFSFALVTVVMFASSILLELIFGNAHGGWKFWLMQGLYTALIGGSAVLYGVFAKTNVFAAAKLNKPPRAWHTVWGCVAVAFLVLCMSEVNSLFLDLIERLGQKRPSVSLENNVAGLIICACILPALSEEIVFRGTVAQSLHDGNKVAALLISGALFSVFHANPAQTLHQFVLGALLTLLVFRSGSLWTAVIVHFFNNAFVVALSYTPLDSEGFWNLQTNTPWALTLTIVGAVGFVLSVLVYVATTNSSWNKTENKTTNESETAVPKNTKICSVLMLVVAVVACAILWVAQLLAS